MATAFCYFYIFVVLFAEAKKIRVYHSDEEKLFDHLFRKYNNRIRPVRNSSEPVNVALTFSLMQLHHLDEKVQVLKTYGWLIVEWRDERLSWNTRDFESNLTQFVVDSPLIWTPELALINAVQHQFPDFRQHRAIINHDGRIRWEPAGVFETFCQIDITLYPYDYQQCAIVFGTWSYTSYKVNLTNSSDAVCLDDYNKSGEWDIVGSRVEQKHFSYSDDPGMRFSKIAATINMLRRHRYYTLNLILPCAMLSSLTLVTFLSPPDQGEKISLGISILLSFSVFMLSLSENLPKTSETIPLFGIYTTFVMLMNTWSVMLTVLVLNLHHRNECRPIPGWLRTFALVGLARLLGMYSRKHPIIFPPDRRKSSAHEFLKFSIQQLEAGRDKKKDRSKKVQFSRKLSEQLRNNQFVCPVHDDLVPNSSPTSLPTKNSRVSWSMDTVRDRTEESEDRCFDRTRNSFLSHESGFSRQEASADDEEVMIEIQEWKQLARIMDRLFFWMTLTALISVSFVLACLLFWQSNNE